MERAAVVYGDGVAGFGGAGAGLAEEVGGLYCGGEGGEEEGEEGEEGEEEMHVWCWGGACRGWGGSGSSGWGEGD